MGEPINIINAETYEERRTQVLAALGSCPEHVMIEVDGTTKNNFVQEMKRKTPFLKMNRDYEEKNDIAKLAVRFAEQIYSKEYNAYQDNETNRKEVQHFRRRIRTRKGPDWVMRPLAFLADYIGPGEGIEEEIRKTTDIGLHKTLSE